jgi:SWI/SNF-related matrix-associated actin-dependent regulator 1 of chromatin subfamily A
MASIRHSTALAKVPYVISHCDMLLETAEKIVLYAHHVDVIHTLYDGLKRYNPVVLYGDVPIDTRMNLVNKFNSDPSCRICIIGIMLAQGMSLASSDIGIFAEMDWVPGIMNQAEDRLFDISKKNGSILIQHLVVEDSLDSKMVKMIMEKQEIIDKALDEKLC